MGLAKPGKARGLMGTVTGLARPEAADWVVGRFWNRTELFIWSKPGLLAGYPYPLQPLLKAQRCDSFTSALTQIALIAVDQ
jgi:hypothetical protein